MPGISIMMAVGSAQLCRSYNTHCSWESTEGMRDTGTSERRTHGLVKEAVAPEDASI